MDNSEQVTKTIRKHQDDVAYWLRDFSDQLVGRSKYHDASKLIEPEKSMFDEFAPKLKTTEFGSDEYNAQLEAMGEALRHHYKLNRHHPEFFDNGINGMTLIDLVEMLCDWMAAANEKGTSIDLDYLGDRFKISPQLMEIISNTLANVDFWNEINGCPVVQFSKVHWSKCGQTMGVSNA